MTKSEMKKFRGVLEARVIEFDNSAWRRDAILIEGSADDLERMHGAVERELAVRTLEAVSTKAREARAALHRMETGAYGICEECEEPISPKRLAALPSAALCIRCQQAMDCRCGARSVRPVLAMAA